MAGHLGDPANARVRARFHAVIVVAALFVIAGCGGAAPTVTPLATPTTVAVAPTPAITAAPSTAAPTAPAVTVAKDVAFELTNALLEPDELDVYAPASGGPWPVVVMFHGTPSATDKTFLAEHALRVAAAGYVVFVASWGHAPVFSQPGPYDYAAATRTQAACAVAYAAAHAADYHGDPATLIVFGHSGGGNVASVAAFGPIAPPAGCATQGGPVEADALVAMDGNWLLDPGFDRTLGADSRIYDQMTPWSVLSKRPDLPVVLLRSEAPGSLLEAPLPPEAVGAYLALRDREGVLAALVEKLHPFDDGVVSMVDMQALFIAALGDNGNPASLTTVPASTHTYMGAASWPAFLAAFGEALAAVRP